METSGRGFEVPLTGLGGGEETVPRPSLTVRKGADGGPLAGLQPPPNKSSLFSNFLHTFL